MFENLRADLRAHGGRWSSPGFWVMCVYRFGRWRYRVRPALLRKPLSLAYRVAFRMVQMMTGVELPCEAEVGHGLVIDHGHGIVVSGYARIGDRCRLRSGVVIGLSHTDDPCAPVIGHGVDIGSGAKLLGRITVGDNVLVGANAVVLDDVPSDSVVTGVPAVVRPRRSADAPGARGRPNARAAEHAAKVVP